MTKVPPVFRLLQLGAREVLGLDVGNQADDAQTCMWLQQQLAACGVICVRQPAPLTDALMRRLVEMISGPGFEHRA